MSRGEAVVIKRVKKSNNNLHYGGMWKIAYADFVTAMMTFFLLMWLISATPEESLKGIAKYFTPTITKNQDQNQGAGKSDDVNVEESGDSSSSSTNSLVYGAPVSSQAISEKNKKPSDANSAAFMSIINSIQQQINKDFADNINMDVTTEGLRIQIMDSENRPMFKPGTDEIEPFMARILTVVGNMIKNQPHYVSISGHTASFKDPSLAGDIDYWRLSALRANQARAFLSNIISKDQVIRILGKADKEPFSTRDPYGVKNIRISITLLKNSEVSKSQQSAPDKVFK